MATSPSEFLVFYRRAVVSAVARPFVWRSGPATQTFGFRSLHQSLNARQQKDTGAGKTHTLDRNDPTNIQVEQSKKGRESQAKGEGGNATTQTDSQDSTARVRKEHPKAPDVIIGMQDERGAKGH